MELIRSTLTTLGSNESLIGAGFVYGLAWWLPNDREILTNFPLSSLAFSSFMGLIGSGITFAIGSVMRIAGFSWLPTVVLAIATLYQIGARLGGNDDARRLSKRNGFNGY